MTLAVVVASVLLVAPPVAATTVATTTVATTTVAATTGATSPSSDACAHALDSVAPSSTSPGCRSPASAASSVTADAKLPPPAPRRDPTVLPGELGFVAVVIGVVGGSALVGAQATDPRRLDDDAQVRQRALLVSGASLVGLAGLVGAGAVATVVFDPSTGTLRLPLFSGED